MADRMSENVVFLERRKGSESSLLEKVAYDHEPALRRFLRIRLSEHPDYEDLVQDTFVRLTRQEDLTRKLSQGESSTRSCGHRTRHQVQCEASWAELTDCR